jgi:hypothetical protein
MKDPTPGITYALNSDAAVTLGFAGKRLRCALQALEHSGGAKDRQHLVSSAADALWSYVVQKEALNIMDYDLLNETYNIPGEVWRASGLVRGKVKLWLHKARTW